MEGPRMQVGWQGDTRRRETTERESHDLGGAHPAARLAVGLVLIRLIKNP